VKSLKNAGAELLTEIKKNRSQKKRKKEVEKGRMVRGGKFSVEGRYKTNMRRSELLSRKESKARLLLPKLENR